MYTYSSNKIRFSSVLCIRYNIRGSGNYPLMGDYYFTFKNIPYLIV